MFHMSLITLSASSSDSNPLVLQQEIQNGLCPYCFMQGPTIADSVCVCMCCVYVIQIYFVFFFFSVQDAWNNNVRALLHLTWEMFLQHYIEDMYFMHWGEVLSLCRYLRAQGLGNNAGKLCGYAGPECLQKADPGDSYLHNLT